MIKCGIIGGAGYTAGELIRLLLNHPDAEIVFVNSTSNAGNRVTDIHGGLYGETDLVFTDQLPLDKIDLLFFCTAHGDTRKFMESHEVPAELKIIDLSQDYRIASPEHDFVYGLPELNRRRICKAMHQSGLFCHLYSVGYSAVGQTSSVECGCACPCHHRFDRCRSQAVAYVALQLAE